ncbi:LCP family protein [Corynebacterium breve]|uniref:LCP family protein n=1 Tax=Corynebacterium breve TaxID=3049799 RepID=A0ABY8VDF1_9CORY|nr:LCP family protein [Corynebacterium breve]WIM67528.1 LCP family protein [Corynebacterium breve]
MSSDPRFPTPRDNSDDIVRGADGKPLVDRYGRPVHRRPSRPSQPQRPRYDESTRMDLPRTERPRTDRPRQQMPPRRPAYEPRRTPYSSQQPRPSYEQPGRRQAPAPQPEPVPMHITERQAPRRRAPRRRRRGGCMSGFTMIIATILVLGIVAVLLADARLTRVDAFPDEPIANTAGTNWLLVGSDSRQGLSDEDVERLGTGGEVGPSRTDTIMIMHIPTTGTPTLVSIPRDSLVSIPGYGEDKINASFAYGGPKLLATTVEQETGLRIDHYAEIGMGGLAGVVDAIGGVELCPEYPIQDPLAALDVQAGCQNMDGATALGYVRTRATPQGDIDRVARQREFMGALMSKVTSASVLANPIRSISLLFSSVAMFQVGDGDHIWHLLRLVFAFAGDNNSETVPVGGFMDTSVGNVVLWDEYAAEELFASLR